MGRLKVRVHNLPPPLTFLTSVVGQSQPSVRREGTNRWPVSKEPMPTKACSTCPSKTVRLTYVNRMRLTDRKEMYNYVLAPAHACVVTYGKKIRRLRRSDRTDMFVPSVKTDAIPERNSQRMTSGFGNSQRMTSGFGISH